MKDRSKRASTAAATESAELRLQEAESIEGFPLVVVDVEGIADVSVVDDDEEVDILLNGDEESEFFESGDSEEEIWEGHRPQPMEEGNISDGDPPGFVRSGSRSNNLPVFTTSFQELNPTAQVSTVKFKPPRRPLKQDPSARPTKRAADDDWDGETNDAGSKEVKKKRKKKAEPPPTLSAMIASAILSTWDKKANQKEILEYILSTTPLEHSRESWRNTIKTTLSRSPCFRMLGPNGSKMNDWEIVEGSFKKLLPPPPVAPGTNYQLPYTQDQPESFRTMITCAILSTPLARMTTTQITDYLRAKYNYFQVQNPGLVKKLISKKVARYCDKGGVESVTVGRGKDSYYYYLKGCLPADLYAAAPAKKEEILPVAKNLNAEVAMEAVVAPVEGIEAVVAPVEGMEIAVGPVEAAVVVLVEGEAAPVAEIAVVGEAALAVVEDGGENQVTLTTEMPAGFRPQPPKSWKKLIVEAITSRPCQRMTSTEVSNYLMEHYEYFKNQHVEEVKKAVRCPISRYGKKVEAKMRDPASGRELNYYYLKGAFIPREDLRKPGQIGDFKTDEEIALEKRRLAGGEEFDEEMDDEDESRVAGKSTKKPKATKKATQSKKKSVPSAREASRSIRSFQTSSGLNQAGSSRLEEDIIPPQAFIRIDSFALPTMEQSERFQNLQGEEIDAEGEIDEERGVGGISEKYEESCR